MTLKGFILTDVAYEYYSVIGREKERDQARKNFTRLKAHNIDYSALEQAVTNIYTDQKQAIREMMKDVSIKRI